MLKLESLEIFGFKSFASKVRIDLDDRITAIVGPNGCGKSNLFDAIGWVLGGQSARYLRSQTMEDVIFNGSGKRKRSGFAQVRLRLKLDGNTPVVVNGKEMVGDHLEISRQLYRSGESHYLVNERRCRLKDIRQVIEDIGFGYASYALIAQGRIEAFLTGNPASRRQVIEEAAQIIGYKNRRRNAELKLEMAQQNLLRVNDIVVEVERRLRSLKRQASQARRYRVVQEQFQLVQVQRFLLEARSKEECLDDSRRRLADQKRRGTRLASRAETCERSCRESREARERLEQQLAELRQQQSEARLEVDRHSHSIQYREIQLASNRKQLSDNLAEEKSVKESVQQVEAELEQFKAEQDALARQATFAFQGLKEKQGRVDEAALKLKSAEKELREVQEQLMAQSGELAALGHLQQQFQQQEQDTLTALRRLQEHRTSKQLLLEDSESFHQMQQQLIDQKEVAREKSRRDLALADQRKQSLVGKMEELEVEEADLNHQVIAFKERLQSLQEVEISRSQYSQGVRSLLNHLQQDPTLEVSETLADRIETHPQYEQLVEEFLGQELEYLLVNSMDTAMQGLSTAKTIQGGKCTFLTLFAKNGFDRRPAQLPDLTTARSHEGFRGTLAGLLQIDPEVESAFRRVLPQQAEALVVEDLTTAFSLANAYPESTFVTLQGEALTPRGLLALSTSGSKQLGLLGIKRRKRKLERKLQQAARLQKEQSRQRRDLEKQLAEMAQACQETKLALIQLEKEMIAVQHRRDQGQLELDRHRQALHDLEQESERLQSDQLHRQRQIEKARKSHEQACSRQQESEQKLSRTRKNVDQLRLELERIREQLHRGALAQKVVDERRAARKKTIKRIEEQRQHLLERKRQLSQSSQSARRAIAEVTESIETTRRRLAEAERRKLKLDRSIAKVQQEVDRWKQSQPKLEEQLQKVRKQLEDEVRLERELQVEHARLDTQLDSLRHQCREQLHQELSDLPQPVDEEGLNLEEIRQTYQQLRSRLDSFGPINMTALRDFEKAEERHSFLVGQRADLQSSVEDTRQAIQELNRRSRRQFREAFAAINQHFQHYFQRFFGGGECGMRLLDEDDVLESGLDVFAQPPGKKVQNVMLLAGGEKALTVLALLIGLFTYRRSKFCVLDEVDASLDDSNVARFAQLMSEMSENTQIVLITHNKRTMEAADCLYGVTMNQPGISEAVSVRF